MNNSMVSIIIPVYQKRDYIEKCIQSLLKQTYKNIEIILVDDGSNDGSEKICNKLSQKYSFIKTLHQANKGVSAARNTGIKNSKGKYILFLDSDDYIAENTIEKSVRAMEENNSDMIIFDFVYFNENKYEEISTDLKEGIYYENDLIKLFWKMYETCIAHNVGTKLYKSDIIKNHNILFTERYSILEDISFYIDYMTYCKRVYYINQPMYFYYIHENGSLRSSYKKEFFNAHKSLYGKLYQLLLKKSMIDEYSYKFYQLYIGGLFEIICNEYKYKKKCDLLIEEIINDRNVSEANKYIKDLSIKKKILYYLLWYKQKTIIKLLAIMKVKFVER